jgi:hypothetical protein
MNRCENICFSSPEVTEHLQRPRASDAENIRIGRRSPSLGGKKTGHLVEKTE